MKIQYVLAEPILKKWFFYIKLLYYETIRNDAKWFEIVALNAENHEYIQSWVRDFEIIQENFVLYLLRQSYKELLYHN